MSAAFDSQSSREANEVQHRKYKDLSAEMRRRANMRETHSGGRGTKEENSQRAKLGWEKRKRAKNQENSAIKNSSETQSYDRSQEV